MINIAGFGMLTDTPEQNVADMDAKATADMAMKHRDVVVGIKSAHYQGPEWVSVDRAVAAGTAANVPVMVDFGYFREERPYHQLRDRAPATRRHQHAHVPRAGPVHRRQRQGARTT